MRYRLQLLPEGEEGDIPINYNGFVSRFIYELIQPDTPFAHQTPKLSAGGTNGIPYYTFSNLYIPGVQQLASRLLFSRMPVELTVSILADDCARPEIEERMQDVRRIEFGDKASSDLVVQSIMPIKEPDFKARRLKCRMLSPLASPIWQLGASELEGEQHIHYNDAQFSEAIRAILLAKYRRWKGVLPKDTRLSFSLDRDYLQRRRGRISKLVSINEGEPDERRVKAIVAPFEVEGNPELIRLGYVAGFGERNLLGFGCVDQVAYQRRMRVTAEPPTERSTLQAWRSVSPTFAAR